MHILHVAHAQQMCMCMHMRMSSVVFQPYCLPPLPYPASAVCRVPTLPPALPSRPPHCRCADAALHANAEHAGAQLPIWRRRRRRWWRGRRWRRREDKGGGGLGDGGSLPAELGRPLGGSQPLRARAGGGARARGGPCAGARGGEAPSTKYSRRLAHSQSSTLARESHWRACSTSAGRERGDIGNEKN